MRNNYKRLYAALFCLVFLLVGCTPSTKPYLAEGRDKKWINDIVYIEKALPKVHKNLYFNISEKEFIGQLEDLKKKVPTFSDQEIDIELSKIIASIGDSHTGFSIGTETTYPIELYWFDEGIYITGTSKEYKELLDAKIITLNAKKIEEVANEIKPLLAGANENWFKTQVIYYIPIPSVLQYFGISNSDEIELSVQLTTGEIKKIKMKSIKHEEYVPVDRSDSPKPLYKTHTNENYWYEYLKDEKILYISYNSCRQMREKPFEIFSKEVWDFAEKHEVEKLVLDIRNNRGGISTILDPFIKKLKKSRFNEKDRLYVIIGRDTYSSAILNALTLRKETNAYFVGENTGGKPNHYGEVKQLELPNSKRKIRYSTKYFNWSKENVDTIKPNMLIKETFENYKKATDPVLEWIIKQKIFGDTPGK
ncbi:S41 family peptidase [Clostridium sp. DJ247]|uniref:S41 family peptidase n=1 Tax=Clostridium sp. DJ247 TaxID=2726188 RepID=UPI00162323F2|nr:S41 family peptidase [Clostridium sp. DJ247]MBC2580071.1 peptidase S41 [Clostridium sp. DJ247]